MTVATEILKQAMKLAYFVTIEGVGWPLGDIYGANALAGTFRGSVWATGYHTELTAVLGCTVRSGLTPPSNAITEKADFRTGSLSVSGLSFSIQDNDDWWLQNYTPRKASDDTSLYAATAETVALQYTTTTIPLTEATSFVEGDQVWIGGRELVVLGSKVEIASPVYQFEGSTRGYLGTRRGSSQRRVQDYSFNVWPGGISVSRIARWWKNRRVALWVIVPGESEPLCLWYGRLKSIKNPQVAGTFEFDCAGDFLGELSRKHQASEWAIESDAISNSDTIINGVPNYDGQVQAFQAANKCRRVLGFLTPGSAGITRAIDDIATSDGKYALAAAYNYRWEQGTGGRGSTGGMMYHWDLGGVSALNTAHDDKMLRSFVLINNQAIQLIKTEPLTDYGVQDDPRFVLAEIISSAGTTGVDLYNYGEGDPWKVSDQFQNFTFAPGTKARFLLDNYDQGCNNRFLIDESPMTHPIDYLLAFLTSCDREIAWTSDVDAASTTTVIVDPGSPGWTTDEFLGLGLFCCGSSDRSVYVPPYNKFRARWIKSNDASSITVDKAFPCTPDTSYETYEVRNGIYDVLPLGWGMGVDVRTLDIDAFQHIKVNHLQGAKLGKFILGTQNDINIWELLQKNILGPYGIMLYFDRVKRKISAEYVGEPLADGVIDDYVEINEKHIKGAGELTCDFNDPIKSVELEVRAVENRVVALSQATSTIINATIAEVPALFGGGTAKITIYPREMEASFSDFDMDTIKMSALFNTEKDAEPVVLRLTGLLEQYVVPPPVWSGPLDIELLFDLHPGKWVLVNWDTPAYPTNPFTGARGWTNVVGRIVKMSLPVDGAVTFDASIELFQEVLGGRISPATQLTAKGSDANGAYFDVSADAFNAAAPTMKDWYFWEVGDVITWRSVTGAFKAGASSPGYTITGFGTNFAATPEAATGDRIYVDKAITPAVATGDYVVFMPWADGLSARKQLYSALADANMILGDDDLARRYS